MGFEGWLGNKHLTGVFMMGLYMFGFLKIADKLATTEKKQIEFLKFLVIQLLFTEFTKYVMILHRGDVIDAGEFPFFFCSMPLYLFPLIMYGSDKTKEFVTSTGLIFGIMGGAAVLWYPANVLHPEYNWFYNFGFNDAMVSIFFHMLILLFPIYALKTGYYKFKASDFKKTVFTFVLLSLMAICLNKLIPGADYFFLERGEGNPIGGLIKINWLLYVITMMGIEIAFIYIIFIPAFLREKKSKQMVEYVR